MRPVDDLGRVLERVGVEGVAQQLVDVGRLDPGDRLFLADHALIDHVGGDPDRCGRRPFRGPRLEHVEAAALDRELEILDVAIVRFELLTDALELGIHVRHVGLHLGDLRRGPDARDDVLTLGVGQVLAEELLRARVRVAGEGDPRAGVVAHVPEDHGHDVDGRTQVVGDLLVLPVVARPLAEPAREHRLDGEVELGVGVVREVLASVGLDDRLELRRQRLEGGGVEVRVLLGAVRPLGSVQRVLEALAVDFHHDPAEHLDEPPVRVPAEPLVAREGDQAPERVVIQAEVENRVHHPGHRELRAGAHADEQRVGGIAEALAGPALDLLDRLEHVVPQPFGETLAIGEVVVTGFGRDGEARRGRQARDRHLGQTGALASEQVAHLGVALGAPFPPRVDVALRGLVRPLRGGRGRRRRRHRGIVPAHTLGSGLRDGRAHGPRPRGSFDPFDRSACSRDLLGCSTDDVASLANDALRRTSAVEVPMNPKDYEWLALERQADLRKEAAADRLAGLARRDRSDRPGLLTRLRTWSMRGRTPVDVARSGRDLGAIRRRSGRLI